MSDTAAQISALEDQLVNLRRQKMIEDAEVAARSPTHNLAIEMHEALCVHNHTEGCGWHYEIKNGVHSWGGDHARWLGKAAKIQAFCQTNQLDTSKAIELFKFMKVM